MSRRTTTATTSTIATSSTTNTIGSTSATSCFCVASYSNTTRTRIDTSPRALLIVPPATLPRVDYCLLPVAYPRGELLFGVLANLLKRKNKN